MNQTEKHQLAGVDARERGFSRPVVYEQADGGYQAILRYETTRVVTTAQATPGAALEELIRMLQGQGYSQLRSQLSIRDGTYLGSQESWVEYPDPERNPETPDGMIGRLLGWLRRSPS
ncbi:MAG TPA: hypothetical protein VJ760_05870 [Nitrospiraceae bacterium]|nr:hypothetical protein [Nitrospiraceae bacterium]